MNATIALTKLIGDPVAAPAGSRHAWPLQIQAEGTNIPSEIFVYQIDPAGDRFSCVATVSQMEEYPKFNAESLTSETGIPFYRTTQMTVICHNPDELERIWRIVQEHTQALVANWNASWILVGVQRVTVTEGGEVIS